MGFLTQIRRPGFPAAFNRLPPPVFVCSEETRNDFAFAKNNREKQKKKASCGARLFTRSAKVQKWLFQDFLAFGAIDDAFRCPATLANRARYASQSRS